MHLIVKQVDVVVSLVSDDHTYCADGVYVCVAAERTNRHTHTHTQAHMRLRATAAAAQVGIAEIALVLVGMVHVVHSTQTCSIS